jgi:LCP family protein required for cell wall assembly
MPAAHLAPPRHRTWKQRLLLGVGAGLTVLLLGSATALGYFWQRFNDITRYDVELSPIAKGEPRNYLIVGSDSRENIDPDDPSAGGFIGEGSVTGKRSDTIMILRIDPEREDAALLSLPRDLWVTIADTGRRAKINSAYGRGRQVLIDTIRQNFDIDIHHYVEVDFNGFLGLVDAVGGIPLWFDHPVRDFNTGLDVRETGCVTLGPQMALNFARSRYLEWQDEDGDWHDDGTADLGRITRQQIFIRRAIKTAASEGISNPVKLNQLVGVAVDNVGLDPRLRARDVVSLGSRFADYDSESLETLALPVENGGGPGAVRISDERRAERILNIFRGLPPGAVSPSMIEVEVLNGTGAINQASDVSAALTAVGFTVGTPGDADAQPVARTTVLYARGDETSAVRVARHITGGAVFDTADFLVAGEVVVVTGLDFTSIHEQPAPEGTVQVATSTTATTATTAGTSGSPTSATATTATTAPSVTTSTTVAGVAIGAPPPGERC